MAEKLRGNKDNKPKNTENCSFSLKFYIQSVENVIILQTSIPKFSDMALKKFTKMGENMVKLNILYSTSISGFRSSMILKVGPQALWLIEG